jgi:hypothetical protein
VAKKAKKTKELVGIEKLQDVIDEAFSMGRYSRRKKAKPKATEAVGAPLKVVNRKVAWPTGRTILQVRWMTEAELVREGWKGKGGGVAFDLNDGGIIYASADSEGNAPGTMFGISSRGEAVLVHPVK